MTQPKIGIAFTQIHLPAWHLDGSHGPRGLRCESAAAYLLEMWVRIPPGSWVSVCCDCCVLWSRGLWVGLIARPEEFYRAWGVWVWSWSLDMNRTWLRGAAEPWKKCIRVSFRTPFHTCIYTLPLLSCNVAESFCESGYCVPIPIYRRKYVFYSRKLMMESECEISMFAFLHYSKGSHVYGQPEFFTLFL